MKSIFEQKKSSAVVKESAPIEKESSVLPSNAAAAAMLTSGNKASDTLGKAVFSRLPGKMQAEIPTAEDEADRLSSGISATDAASVKAKLGEKLGADFSNVRFHTGSAAKEYAASVGARAYTTGSDVYFGEGGFNPTVAAHELVHTVQQGAVGSEVQTMSAPSGGIQMWNPFRRKKAPAPLQYTEQKAPGKLAIGDTSKPRKILKGGDMGKADSATVEMVGQSGGEGTGVIKTQTDAELEEALSDYYNTAGTVFASDKKEGNWSFDCAPARALQGEERDKAKQMFASGQLYDRLATGRDGSVDLDMALSRTAAYGTVQGKSVGDASADAATHYTQPVTSDSEGYGKMLGYVGALDSIVGNKDRLAGMYNAENWMEERDKKKIHLIDNVFNQHHAALGALDAETMQPKDSAATMQSWRAQMSSQMDAPDASGKRKLGSVMKNTLGEDELATGELGVTKDSLSAGGDEAGAHLPQIYSKLAGRFAEKAEGGELNKYQLEILQRVYETMKMSDPDSDALDPQAMITKAKADIEAAAYGGQTHGPKPTATSGPGWTKGTASDWLGGAVPARASSPSHSSVQIGSASASHSAPESKPQQPQQPQTPTAWKKAEKRHGFRTGFGGFGYRG